MPDEIGKWIGGITGKIGAEIINNTKPEDMEPVIKKIPLKENQYIQDIHTKKHIILHHTAGGSAASSIAHWASNAERIATPYIIDRNGDIFECYDPKYWAYHLGVKGNSSIEKTSIGIEICSYGCLAIANQNDDKGHFKIGDAITYVGKKIDSSKIATISPFRPNINPFANNPLIKEKVTYTGTIFEAYTPQQIASLKVLLPYLVDKFKIKLQVDKKDFWEYKDPSILPSGIYSHTTVRKDKIDIFPQKELINLVYNI